LRCRIRCTDSSIHFDVELNGLQFDALDFLDVVEGRDI
jgi:hypothetical protein